jgi:hypothetical protein
MQFNNKTTRSVADAVSKILEGTHPKTDKEKDLAALAHPKDKITHKDVLVGRGVLKKEETDCESEAKEEVKKHEKKMHGKGGDVDKHEKEMHKESTGASKDKEEKFHTKLDKLVHKTFGHSPEEKMKKESTLTFSSLIESYKKDGLKSIAKMKKEDVELDEEKMKGGDPCWDSHEMDGHKMKDGKKVPNCVPKNEEVDTETYEKEMKDQKDKFDGKKKGGDVAKASVQAVKQEEVELDERTLTEPETKKKEEVVKSMKKNLQGFKDRYGDKAKSVMYATATKIAKKD